MPYFEFIGEDLSRKSESAAKFWEVTQVGKKVTIRFGKIGADGQLKVKEFESKEDAEAEVAKLIKEKTKKGYTEKPSPHS
jgi:predicted DNA-binding WGR domain protein